MMLLLVGGGIVAAAGAVFSVLELLRHIAEPDDEIASGELRLCGCGKRRHRRAVPLMPNPNPLYPVGDFGIAKAGGPDANVDIDECRCGCCMYESDDDK